MATSFEEGILQGSDFLQKVTPLRPSSKTLTEAHDAYGVTPETHHLFRFSINLSSSVGCDQRE